MLKLLTILSIAYISGVAQGATTNNIDAYLYTVREQNARNVRNYDMEIDALRRKYVTQINAVTTTSQLLFDTLAQAEESLKLLQFLSGDGKSCVDKYIRTIPTEENTKNNATDCTSNSSDQIENQLYYPQRNRNELESYYNETFEPTVSNCKSKYEDPSDCILVAVAKSEAYTTSNQQLFKQNVSIVYCTVADNVKIALDCSFAVENSTISAISVATVNIKQCIWGNDNCNSSYKTSLCSEVKYIPRSQVSTTDKTMGNPYYGTNRTSNCLTLAIV